MLGTQYGLEQLQIWFHRCLHFYVHIYFTRLNELLLALTKLSCMKVFCMKKPSFQWNRILWWKVFCRGKMTILFQEKKKNKPQRQIWGFLLEYISHYVPMISSLMICSFCLALMEKELHHKNHGLAEELGAREISTFPFVCFCFQARYFLSFL